MGQIETAEGLGISESALRRAARIGLLRGAHKGWRKMEEGERAWLRGHWGLVGALRAVLRTEPNVRSAWVFGSVARGEDDMHSDLDLVVRLARGGPIALRQLQRRLEAKVSRRVDLFEQEDLEAEPEFMLPLLKEARVVVDREGWWEDLGRHKHRLEQRLRARRVRELEWAV